MKSKNQEGERRKYKRLDIAIPTSIKLLGPVSSAPPIDVETDNISLEGLSIVIKIRLPSRRGSIQEGEAPVKLVPYLLLDNKVLDLSINILPRGEGIKGIGQVKWYDRRLRENFYDVRAGIFIEEMRSEDRGKWLEFLRTVARLQYNY